VTTPPEDPYQHWRTPNVPYGATDQPLAAPRWRARRGPGAAVAVVGVVLVLGAAAAGALLYAGGRVRSVTTTTTSRPIAVTPLRTPDATAEWTSVSFTLRCGPGEHPMATARIRNDSGVTHTVFVSYTLRHGEQELAVLRGAAPEVRPRATATITLIAGGPCVRESYVADFHVDRAL
jgi:hypothetical protein